MTSRNRIASTNIVSQENTANVKAMTIQVRKQTARRALGEIGNKVNVSRATRVVNKPNAVTKVVKEENVEKAIVKPTVAVTANKIVEKVAVRASQHPAKKEPTVIYALVNCNEETMKKEPEAFSSDLLAPNAPIEDIDVIDADNPALVSNYSNDIYNYLKILEKRYPISDGFLKGHHITAKMRGTLVDWLIDVHQQFKLFQETLYLTIAVIDRFLQVEKTITRKRLQLVGVTAMFIAAKYEETYPPGVSDFVYITDNAYKRSEVIEMEVAILEAIDFSLGRPLPLHFLRRYSKAGRVLPVHHTMAKYFLELCLVHYELSHHSPSLISAAALYLSLYVIGNDNAAGQVIWTKTLAHYSTYTTEDLLPIVHELAAIVVNADNSKFKAARMKFTHVKHMKISLRPELKSPSLLALAKK